jgi:hypothetical protein
MSENRPEPEPLEIEQVHLNLTPDERESLNWNVNELIVMNSLSKPEETDDGETPKRGQPYACHIEGIDWIDENFIGSDKLVAWKNLYGDPAGVAIENAHHENPFVADIPPTLLLGPVNPKTGQAIMIFSSYEYSHFDDHQDLVQHLQPRLFGFIYDPASAEHMDSYVCASVDVDPSSYPSAELKVTNILTPYLEDGLGYPG